MRKVFNIKSRSSLLDDLESNRRRISARDFEFFPTTERNEEEEEEEEDVLTLETVEEPEPRVHEEPEESEESSGETSHEDSSSSSDTECSEESQEESEFRIEIHGILSERLSKNPLYSERIHGTVEPDFFAFSEPEYSDPLIYGNVRTENWEFQTFPKRYFILSARGVLYQFREESLFQEYQVDRVFPKEDSRIIEIDYGYCSDNLKLKFDTEEDAVEWMRELYHCGGDVMTNPFSGISLRDVPYFLFPLFMFEIIELITERIEHRESTFQIQKIEVESCENDVEELMSRLKRGTHTVNDLLFDLNEENIYNLFRVAEEFFNSLRKDPLLDEVYESLKKACFNEVISQVYVNLKKILTDGTSSVTFRVCRLIFRLCSAIISKSLVLDLNQNSRLSAFNHLYKLFSDVLFPKTDRIGSSYGFQSKDLFEKLTKNYRKIFTVEDPEEVEGEEEEEEEEGNDDREKLKKKLLELLAVEEDFCTHLKETHFYYGQYFCSKKQTTWDFPKDWLNNHVVVFGFQMIQNLKFTSHFLLEKMRTSLRAENEEEEKCPNLMIKKLPDFCRCVLENWDVLRCLSPYFMNYGKFSSKVSLMSKHENNFFKKQQAKCQRMGLRITEIGSFLITPIQQPIKHTMFLKDIKKYANRLVGTGMVSEETLELVNQAYWKTREVADFLNDERGRSDLRIEWSIKQALISQFGTRKRKLLKEGVWKFGVLESGSVKCYVVLFNDLIVVKDLEDLKKKRKRCLLKIRVEDFELEYQDVKINKAIGRVIIRTKNNGRFIIFFEDTKDVSVWRGISKLPQFVKK